MDRSAQESVTTNRVGQATGFSESTAGGLTFQFHPSSLCVAVARSDSLAATASPVPWRALWRKFHLRTPGDFCVGVMESTVPAFLKDLGLPIELG